MGRPPWGRSPTALKIAVLLFQVMSSALSKRHVVYWNSTNTRLSQENYTIDVDLNDYLDIYCPHYPPGLPTRGPIEILTLYQVLGEHFRGCVETEGAIKRWECNRPYAPFGPVRFSEKIQKYSPFSVGLEFRPGHHYYYSSLSGTDGPSLPCLKLRVSVCCATGSDMGCVVLLIVSGSPEPSPAIVLLLEGSRQMFSAGPPGICQSRAASIRVICL